MIQWQVKFLAIVACCFTAEASFYYGEPCSDRNTAYLYPNTWKIPENITHCVDLTGYRNHSHHEHHKAFFELVAEATTLYADHMNLTFFPANLVYLLPRVETIDFSGNQLRRFSPRADVWAPHITKFLLADNLLQMPRKRPLIRSNTLQTLMLSNNKIGKIYPITFSKLPVLEVLYLDGNHIKYIYPQLFVPLSILKYLHLGDNAIIKFPSKEKMPPLLKYYIQKKQRKLEPIH